MNASSLNSAQTLENRLRQIAILVASVDTTAARQLLMHLPTEIAKRVRAMAADIGPVPPEERRALLAEFQKSQAQLKAMASTQEPARPSPESGLAQNQFGSPSPVYSVDQPLSSSAEPSWTRLSVETLVRLVKIERPTVIAVVLQQLPAAQAAAVLQRLPRSTTREVLQTLGSMQDIDEEARQAIDEHLSERLRDYHHKMENELEQSRRMSELLAAAPSELKQQWAAWLRPDVYIDESSVQSARPVSATASALNTLDRLYQSATITTNDAAWMSDGTLQPATNKQTAAMHAAMNSAAGVSSSPASGVTNLGQQTVPFQATQPTAQTPAQSSATQQPANTASQAKADSSRGKYSEDQPHTIPFPGVQSSGASGEAGLSADQRKAVQNKMEKMLSLAPEQLAQLLSSLDSQTILYALAGASPNFMKRFCGMLEPEDAKELDKRLKRIGTVSLRDIDQAQQRLVSSYEAMVGKSNSTRGLFGMRSQKRAA